jgi:hypothetical protein
MRTTLNHNNINLSIDIEHTMHDVMKSRDTSRQPKTHFTLSSFDSHNRQQHVLHLNNSGPPQ